MYQRLRIHSFSADHYPGPLQGCRSRTKGNRPWNVWVLCESYLWCFGHVCDCVFACLPSMQESRKHPHTDSAPLPPCLGSPSYLSLSASCQSPSKTSRGRTQGLNSVTWATHAARSPWCPWTLSTTSIQRGSWPCCDLPKPILPAWSFIQILTEEDHGPQTAGLSPASFAYSFPLKGESLCLCCQDGFNTLFTSYLLKWTLRPGLC